MTQVTQEAERELTAARARLAADQTGQPLPPLSTTLPTGPAVQRVLAAVGLREPGDAAHVTVGLIGPVPPREALGDANIEVVDGPASSIAAPDLIGHQATVLQVTRLLAPSATFVFAPFGISRTAITNDALVDALRRLIERQPPIILMAWGGSEPNTVLDDLIRQAADKI